MLKDAPKPSDLIQDKLLHVVHAFLVSLEKRRAADLLSLDSKIAQDLSIDSLGRVELFHQIENAFTVYLPETLLGEAETIRDILNVIEKEDYTEKLTNFLPSKDFSVTRIDPSTATSLVDILIQRGQKEPARVHIYFQDEKGVAHPITYGELLAKSMQVASTLHEMGLRAGDTMAIMLPTCQEFFHVFMGAMLAGVIPVPIYPPIRPDKIEEYALREAIILKNAEVRMLVTFHQAEKLCALLKVFIPTLMHVVKATDLFHRCDKIPSVVIREESAAFIQYTSGSTNDPKGVFLTHSNLLANIRSIQKVVKIQPHDLCVSWLPLYHDMGLIGCWLSTFYIAIPLVVMSPLTFLSRPERWLWAIHYHKATVSAAPNFAYELCTKKIQDAAIQGLDLSSWRMSFNGAEQINPMTAERFNKKFQPYGLRNTTIYPAYGLAESSVALMLPREERPMKVDTIHKSDFETSQLATKAPTHLKSTLNFVSVGEPLPDHEVKILDKNDKPLPDRHIGRLFFKGPSMMQGYYRNEKATEAIQLNGWYDTGDYAYKADGEYYITGRRKDLIIKAGRNFYPEEIELVTSQCDHIRKGCVIAFGTADKLWSTEKLIIVAETKETERKIKQAIVANVIDRVSAQVGIPPDEVILIPLGAIPKTSSGKLQRSKCKQMYECGTLKSKTVPLWIQLSRLTGRAVLFKAWREAKKACQIVYTGYVYLCVFFAFVTLAAVMRMTPKSWGRPLAKLWAKTTLNLILIRVCFKGSKSPIKESQRQCIYVANHASYIDSVVFLSTLPNDVVIVGKKEVLHAPLLGFISKQIGLLSVDRYDISKSIDDAQKLVQAIHDDKSLLVFPEGTFVHATGLRNFKLGAFKIATETHIPICPIAIEGTRKILRGDSKLFKPGKVTVTIGDWIYPNTKSWDDVAQLHSRAKAFIAEHCGESVVVF